MGPNSILSYGVIQLISTILTKRNEIYSSNYTYIFNLFDLRKNGIEAGGKIWWNSYRPIHGMLFILYSIYAFKGENAYIVLLLDVFIGLFVWIHKYYLTKEFLHVDS